MRRLSTIARAPFAPTAVRWRPGHRRTTLPALLALAACSGSADVAGNCSLQGYGEMSCAFTNHGSGTGSTCVRMTVTNRQGATMSSSAICSGLVEGGDVRDRVVSGGFETTPAAFCDAPDGKDWKEGCTFSLEEAEAE